MSDEADKTAAPAVAVTEVAAPPAMHAIIDAWHRDHFAGMPTTELWNVSFAAKEDLKKRLAKT